MHWSDWVMVNTGFLSHQIGWMYWPLIVMWRWYWSKNLKWNENMFIMSRDEMMLYWVRLKCLLKSWLNRKCWFTHSSCLHVENYSSLCCSYSPTVFGTSWCPLIRRPLIHSGVTLRNENPLVYSCFVVWWIQAQGKLGVYCKTGKIYSSICFTGLLTSLPPFSESLCHVCGIFLNLLLFCFWLFFSCLRVSNVSVFVFLPACVLLTCSHRDRASESRPDTCHTSPLSRRLGTRTFPPRHTADSPSLKGTADGSRRKKAEQETVKGLQREGGQKEREEDYFKKIEYFGSPEASLVNYMKWVNISLIICPWWG